MAARSWRDLARRLLLCAIAALAGAASAADLSGAYSGLFQGEEASAELRQQGAAVSGRYVVGGYPYQLQFRMDGDRGDGELLDPATGGRVPLVVAVSGSELLLAIYLLGTDGPAVSATLRRAAGSAGAAPAPAKTPSAGPRMPGGELDPALVGAWSRSESYTSGDFSVASEAVVILAPDGRVVDGGARVAGGGNAGSFDSGARAGGEASGHWSTRERILYLNEGAGWQPVARYYVEGNRALLTRADGSRQLWQRR